MDDEQRINSGKNAVALISIVISIGVAIGLGIFWKSLTQESAKLDSQLTLTNESLNELKATVNELQKKTKENKEAIIQMAIDNFLDKDDQVDFTNSQIQNIGSGFNLAGLEMKEHLTGLKFSGRIINTQSVRHRNVDFKIKIGKQEKDFTVNQISPGNSTSFSVYVPDIKPEDAHYGKIKYQGSSVEYYVK